MRTIRDLSFEPVARDNLPTYNRLVLACQDRAYGFASLLVNDDSLASQITSTAFVQTYHAWQDQPEIDFEIELIRQIIKAFNQLSNTAGTAAGDVHGDDREHPRANTQDCTAVQPFSRLPVELRLPLALVDGQGSDYHQAAQVLNISLSQVKQQVARGRVLLMANVNGC